MIISYNDKNKEEDVIQLCKVRKGLGEFFVQDYEKFILKIKYFRWYLNDEKMLGM